MTEEHKMRINEINYVAGPLLYLDTQPKATTELVDKLIGHVRKHGGSPERLYLVSTEEPLNEDVSDEQLFGFLRDHHSKTVRLATAFGRQAKYLFWSHDRATSFDKVVPPAMTEYVSQQGLSFADQVTFNVMGIPFSASHVCDNLESAFNVNLIKNVEKELLLPNYEKISFSLDEVFD